MKALLLCGPPGCGKDTIAKILAEKLSWCYVAKFAKPIVDFLLRNFGIDMARVDKDSPHPALLGRTPREVAIAFSEKFCKPLFGQNFFGTAAVAEMKKTPGVDVFIFSDSGFVTEAVEVLQFVGQKNIRVIHIHRNGCSFEKDSRSYWTHPLIGELLFENHGDGIDSLRADIQAGLLRELQPWLESRPF